MAINPLITSDPLLSQLIAQSKATGVTGGYGDMIRIVLFVGRINEEGIGVGCCRSPI